MGQSRARKSLGDKTIRALKTLHHADKNQRVLLLKNADHGLVKGICECVLNVLNGCVKICDKTRKKLGKYKKVLRNIVDRRKTEGGWKSKKRLILQKGAGFLPLVLGTIIHAILQEII